MYAIGKENFRGCKVPKYFGNYEDIVSLAWKMGEKYIFFIDLNAEKPQEITLKKIFTDVYMFILDIDEFRDYIYNHFEIPYYDIDTYIIPELRE